MLDFSVTFGITIINIVILFFILKAVLFKPVSKFIEARKKGVEDTLAAAEKDREEAAALRVQYEALLKNADSEAETILKTARNKAEAEAASIIEAGKAEREALLAGGRAKLEQEEAASIARFRAGASSLVIAAASRLVSRNLNNDDNRRFTEMMLQELSKQQYAKGRV